MKLSDLTESHFGWPGEGSARVVESASANVPAGSLEDVTWWGEVVDLHLDGTVSVRLPGGGARKSGIKQLILLNDPMGEGMLGDMMGMDEDEQMQEGEGDEWYDDDGEEHTDHGHDLGNLDLDELLDAGGTPVGLMGYFAHHTHGQPGVMEIELAESEMDVEEVDPMMPRDGTESDRGEAEKDTIQQDRGYSGGVREEESEAGPSKPRSGLGLLGDQAWQSFDVLEEAPADHHFYTQPRTAPQKSYLSRLQKEQRALMTSLPGE
jgi:ubiquitin-conjugating enzyme E2 O